MTHRGASEDAERGLKAPKVLAIWVAFGGPMGLLFWWQGLDWPVALVLGLLAGCLFAGAMAYLQGRGSQGGEVERDWFGDLEPFAEDEPVLREGLANHFKGIEGVGGKLYLTNRRLRFVSHKLNVQTHDECYPLSEIAEVEATRTLGIIPNGLRVTVERRQEGALRRLRKQGVGGGHLASHGWPVTPGLSTGQSGLQSGWAAWWSLA